MRALLALATALLLAGCQVDLEGAACAVPGSSDQCPSGQRCGVDLRCSSSPLLTCPAPSGVELLVDPAAPAGAPTPSGARSPAACRFRSLDQALAAAAQLQGAVVRAVAATYPVTATLAIPAGVTLQADEDPLVPDAHVLRLEGALAAGVSLAERAALSGFTIRNGSAPASAVGVEIACAAGTAARLADVKVEAAGATAALAIGVRAGGVCPVELDRITVQGASSAGLLVTRDAAASTLVATDVTLDGNGEGVRITRGDVTLTRPVVTASTGAGVIASPAADQDVLLTIDHGAIRANGDTGVVVQGNQAGQVRLSFTHVCSNQAVTPRGGSYAQRKVGGLYLFGNPPPVLALEGNAFFGNAGDQLLVAGVGGWALDGAPAGATACGAGANLFDAYASSAGGTTYVGLFAANAAVTARWNAWRVDAPPLASVDYAASGAGGSVAVGTIDPAQYCQVSTPTCD
jgi:hypothetical protein